MPKRVKLPDGKIAEFPDDMANDAIEKVLQEQFGGASDKPAEAPAQPKQSLAGAAFGEVNRRVADTASRIVSGVGESLNPMNLIKSAGQMVTSPIETGKAMLGAQGKVLTEGVEQVAEGNLLRGGRKLAAGMIPLLGVGIDAVADRAESGELPEALGEGIGMAASMLFPAKLPKSVKIIKQGKPQAALEGAMKIADERGIPLSVGDVSDNAFVRGAQQVGGSTIGGGKVAEIKRATQASSMRRVAGELMEETSKKPATPESAGRGVGQALEQKALLFELAAGSGYDNLAKAAADPKNLRSPIPPAFGVRRAEAARQATANTTPIAFPVDYRAIKSWAEDSLGPLKQRALPADPQAAKVMQGQIKSLESIAKGPDFKPAMIAEKDLSNLKALTRNATEQTELTMRGTQEMDKLTRAIDQAVAGDPKAVKGLDLGRKAWRRKSEIEEVAKTLRTEPVQAFKQATWRNDTGIDFLRTVAKEVPEEMASIGRAWLEETFGGAMKEGGFSGGKGLMNQWKTLGPETKKLLFKDPALLKNLDDFFALAKRIDSPINTSMTAPTAMAGKVFDMMGAAASASAASFVPMIASQVGAAGFTALMYNPKFVKAINRGLSAPVRSPAQAAAITQMMKIAQESSSEMNLLPQNELSPAGALPQ